MENHVIRIMFLYPFFFLVPRITLAQEQDTPVDVCRKKASADVDEMDQFFTCKKKGYDYASRLTKHTEVEISYAFDDIFYSTVTGIYLSGVMLMEWQDDNFIWNDTYPSYIRSRNVAGLWKPEIYMDALSNYDSDKRLFRQPVISQLTGGGVHITRTGTVFLMYETMLTVLCPHQDLKYFPYDMQTCRLELFTAQNVSFKVRNNSDIYALRPIMTGYQILAYNVSTAESSVYIDVTFLRYDHMFWIKLYMPNLGLCIFLLLPLWLSPANILRLVLPTLSFMATMYQMQTLATMIPDSRIYSGDILMLDFYRNLLILSLLLLVHNFYSCLIHRRKVFLPARLNRFYAKLYSMEFCKKLTQAETYLEVEKQQSEENTENLEAIFHTWSELLRLVDVILLPLILSVEVFSYIPTIYFTSSSKYEHLG